MKFKAALKPLLFIAFAMLAIAASAQDKNTKYNKALADSLGADDYGMKRYVLVILKTGSTKMDDKTRKDSIFGGHLQNIRRLADEGSLVVAGPLFENAKSYEGIFILDVKTTGEAKTLLDTDPAVHAGLLDTALFGWYGSAALPLYLRAVNSITKKHF